jgi:hypothetical protein
VDEWSRALDVRLSECWCSVSMVWVQIPSREEQKFDSSKNLILTLFGLIFRRIYIYIYIYSTTVKTATSDKVYQLLAQGRWFSPGTPASSTTKTGRHDIAEILLKVALNIKIQIQSCICFLIVKFIYMYHFP